jgi:signal transduction histidine kinase
MTPRRMKWMIPVIPAVVLGLWEWVRHTVLLPYISMELGNWLAPFIVFVASVIFLLPLLRHMERVRDELHREREHKAALVERERIARELHDGVAQSLFLLTVQADRLEREGLDSFQQEYLEPLRRTVHQVNTYVRQAISDLRTPAEPAKEAWRKTVEGLSQQFQEETGISLILDWKLPEELLDAREKIELLATIREALMNVRKHAYANQVWITAGMSEDGWVCSVEDDGVGFPEGEDAASPAAYSAKQTYGLTMIRERASRLGWSTDIERAGERTRVKIRKKGRA